MSPAIPAKQWNHALVAEPDTETPGASMSGAGPEAVLIRGDD